MGIRNGVRVKTFRWAGIVGERKTTGIKNHRPGRLTKSWCQSGLISGRCLMLHCRNQG